MRILPSRATQASPYTLVFKQYPEVPLEGQLRVLDHDVSLELCKELVDEAVEYWGYVFEEVQCRLAAGEIKMAQEYARRADLAK